MTFDESIRIVLEHEGGFSDDPDDTGGPTNFGVSLRWLKSVKDDDDDGWLEGDFDHDGDVDVDDIRKMTMNDAVALYKRQWWDRYGYDKLSGLVGFKTFDFSINMGPGRAHRLLQEALNTCGEKAKVDGKLGPLTLEAASRCAELNLLLALMQAAMQFYIRITIRRPKNMKFLAGWGNRVFSFGDMSKN